MMAGIEEQIEQKCDTLSDSGGIGCPGDAHGRKKSVPEDHERIQNNIYNTAAHHTEHGYFHIACGLKDFLKRQSQSDNGRKALFA